MTDLLGVSPELVGSVSFGGLRAYALGYAVDPDTQGTVYLSLVGYRTAVRGVWAALMDNQPIELASQLFRRAEGAYVSRTVQLPQSGLEHMVLLYHQAAVPQLEARQPFYLLNGADADRPSSGVPVDRFTAMFDRATASPLCPSWGFWLARQGIKRKLIVPLPETRGVEAWRVSADSDLWLALIEQGIQKGALEMRPTSETQ